VNTGSSTGHEETGAPLSASATAFQGAFPLPSPLPSAGVKKRANPVSIMTFQALMPGTQTSSEAATDLVQRLKKGDVSAVGEAYDLHHEHVRRFARRLLSDEDAAEDLVHETFLTLPKAVKNFEGRSALRTFMVSIAVNHSRHYVRAASRRRAAMDRAASQPLAPGHSNDTTCPEKEVARKQMAQILTRCLDKLSMQHRVAFVLCEVEDRNSREVAEILEVPEGTVRTRLMHAKKKLRVFLSEEGLS